MQLLTKDLGRRALRRSRPPGRSKKSTVGVGAAALGHSSSVSDFAASALHRAWAGCACCASSGFEREPRLFESGLLQPGRATTNLTRLAAHGQATRLWAEHCGSIGSVADNKFTLLWVQLHTDSGMAEASRGLGTRDFQGLPRAVPSTPETCRRYIRHHVGRTENAPGSWHLCTGKHRRIPRTKAAKSPRAPRIHRKQRPHERCQLSVLQISGEMVGVAGRGRRRNISRCQAPGVHAMISAPLARTGHSMFPTQPSTRRTAKSSGSLRGVGRIFPTSPALPKSAGNPPELRWIVLYLLFCSVGCRRVQGPKGLRLGRMVRDTSREAKVAKAPP